MSSKRKVGDSGEERKPKKQATNQSLSSSKSSTSKVESRAQAEEDSFFEESEPSASLRSITVSDSNLGIKTPGRKRSFKRISVNYESPLPMNDDGTELIEEDEIEDAGEEGGAAAASQEQDDQEMAIVHSMTKDQMKEHVSRCLELNTENKINSKNAFALRLIDCMTILSKSEDDSNFAAMAVQLDAGAKIYSHRVDAVHNQVVKLVDSCIFAEKKANAKGDGGADSDDDDPQPGTSDGRLKEKKRKRKKVLANKDQVIRVLKETDPKERYFNCEALPGAIFNQVGHDPQDLSLTLAKDTPFWMDWVDYKPAKAVEELTCEVEKIVIEDQAIGPNLEDTIDPTSLSLMEPSYIEQSVEEPSEPVDLERPIMDSDYDDEVVFNEPDPEAEPNTDDESKSTLVEVEVVSRAMSRMSKAGNKDVSRLDALNAVFHRFGENEYHYLKKSNSKYWAGPKRGIIRVANKKKPPTRKKKEPKPIVYSEAAMQKPLNPVSKTTGLPTKRRTTLSGNMCSKWKSSSVTNQRDIHFDQKTLVTLFNIELENVAVFQENKDEPVQEEEIGGNVMESSDEDPDHVGADMLISPVPSPVELQENLLAEDMEQDEPEAVAEVAEGGDPDPEGFLGWPLDSSQDGVGESGEGPGAEDMQIDVAETQSQEGGGDEGKLEDVKVKADESCEVYEGDNLVPMVKMVNVEPIKYSFKPHRIDMGHLKEVMFSIIVRKLEDRENELRTDGQSQGRAYVQFRDVLTELMNSDELHHRTRDDLTTAMAFLTLLFLANEYELRLDPNEGGTDNDPRISWMSGEKPDSQPSFSLKDPDDSDSD